MAEARKKRICIVVLGDIGRSPRMQYHALSFLREGYVVDLVGYSGSNPVDQLSESTNCKLHYICCPEFKKFLPGGLAHVVKVLWQIITLFITLLFLNNPDFVLVQNPPAVPALFVCYIYCKLIRAKFVIDWHNYTYTILSLSLGSKHPLVNISKWFEFYFGQKADSNLCVTKAMKEDLFLNHNVKAVTFYDRPPDFFKQVSLKEKHSLFLKLGIEYNIFIKNCAKTETVFTRFISDSEIVLRKDRPAFIISSTSWTEDEDFSILVSALDEYEKLKAEAADIPQLICAITGKGPLKDFYRDIIRRRNWKFVTVITPWLEAEDYPKLLGCADLGVCLHKSSSGFDLPMKVVDMFGCSVPVCAIRFQCISELVKHEENGFIFSNSYELFKQMEMVFHRFPWNDDSSVLNKLRENIEKFRSLKWHDNWMFNVNPIFSTV